MADSSKKTAPARFSADLFASPNTSSGLSLNFETNFSSPFSLVAAKTEAPPAPAANLQTGSSTPLSSSQRSSPAPDPLPVPQVNSAPPASSPRAPLNPPGGSTELSTVPLDSPIASSASSEPPGVSPPIHRSATDTPLQKLSSQGQGQPRKREYEYGWNDPPASYPTIAVAGETPSRPTRTMTAPQGVNSSPGNIQIQPLADPLTSSQGPPGPSTQVTDAGANPYRIGTGVATRKPNYGVSGIASFGSAPSSSSGSSLGSTLISSQPGMALPAFQPTPPLQNYEGASQSVGAPPTAGYPSNSSSLVSSLPSDKTTWSQGSGGVAAPIRHHWFYLRPQENYWIPFSLVDSDFLEEAVSSCLDTSQEVLVPTDGGRYDVDLHGRQRAAVYWEEPPSQVRRCSWFYKRETDRWYLPYDEETAKLLEEEYQTALEQSSWNRRVEVEGGEFVVFHSHSSIVHYSPNPASNTSNLDYDSSHSHPRAVMRGFAELDKVELGEQSRVDHLVFMVHGIGGFHDINFRSLVDCVDDFREVSQLMLKTHQFSGQAPRGEDGGGRVEYLPVHWHAKLHTTGVDDRLKPLTLPSISRLRDFTNSTLLDILYFTSPLFCQTIVSEVAEEMNRMYEIFKQRNPLFGGGVSVVGHSLGAVILFDLLYHQQKNFEPSVNSEAGKSASVITSTGLSEAESEPKGVARETGGVEEGEEPDGSSVVPVEEVLAQLGLENLVETFQKEQIDVDSLLMCSNDDLKELGLAMGPRKKLVTYIAQETQRRQVSAKRRAREAAERQEREQREAKEAVDSAAASSQLFGVKIIKGVAGTGQTHVDYPQLTFSPQQLFALGSPVGLFLTVRGVEELGPDFSLPTCPHVFNIFHPFDPVAYRMEPLVSDCAPKQAYLMPHHKGRKRFHLELYENIGYVGKSIKHHLVEGVRNMWQQLNDLARSHTSNSSVSGIEQVTEQESITPSGISGISEPSMSGTISGTMSGMETAGSEMLDEDILTGRLNQGRRIDHVLQEKPIEKLNEYLFALSSHLCYWHSEDTALFILKEVYQERNPTLVKS